MKKLFLLATLSMLISFSSLAQYDKGDFLLSVGVGAGYYYAGGVPLMLSGEYAVTDNVTIGGYFGYTTWNWARYDYRYTFIDFGGRGSYHFSELFNIRDEKIDVYGGASLGFLVSSYSGPNNAFFDDDIYGGGVRLGLHAGFRYMFAEKVGGYAELGIGYVPLSLGLTFKL